MPPAIHTMQRFYVARRTANAAHRLDAVEERGAVRFYDDPLAAQADADRRGGAAAGFVVMAVFIGATGRPIESRLEFDGDRVRASAWGAT